MLKLDDLYLQKISGRINQKINTFFNKLIASHLWYGRLLAFFIIFAKCLLHTFSILCNTLEYLIRGFIPMLSSKAAKEYFSTLGSFLVINSINAITLIPDIFIRTYFAIKDARIDSSHTTHTLYYAIMRLI